MSTEEKPPSSRNKLIRDRLRVSLRTYLLFTSIVAAAISLWAGYRWHFTRQLFVVEGLWRRCDSDLSDSVVDYQWRRVKRVDIYCDSGLCIELELNERKDWVATLYPQGTLIEVTGVTITLSDSKLLDSIILEVAKLTSIASLTVHSDAVTVRQIAELQSLRQLTQLSLLSSAVSDRMLGEVSNISTLSELGIPLAANVTDAGIKQLGKLPRLSKLAIGFEAAHGEGFEALAGLKELVVHGGRISPKGYLALSRCRELEELTVPLYGSRLDSADAARLAEMPNLRKLRLIGASLTDASLRAICESRTIENLWFGASDVTVEGFAAIERLPLSELYVDELDPGIAGIVSEIAKLKALRELHIFTRELLKRVGTMGRDNDFQALCVRADLKRLDLPRAALNQQQLKRVEVPAAKYGRTDSASGTAL